MKMPHEKTVLSDGHPLMVYQWPPAEADALSILFLHATSFHGRCWDKVIRQLPEYHCYAADMRGHGQSHQPESPLTWRQGGEDATAIVRALGLRGAIGVGHSMGGNVLVRAAAALPGAFSALLLLDPVILPREWYSGEDYSIDGHFTLGRRRQWDSPDEMFHSFQGRGPFASWDEDILHDYCRYGLLPNGNGYRLACSPEIETHIYGASRLAENGDIYEAVSQVSVPVRVLRCAHFAESVDDLHLSPTAPDLAAQFPNGRDYPLPDHTHYIPMESPSLVIRHIRELIAESERAT